MHNLVLLTAPPKVLQAMEQTIIAVEGDTLTISCDVHGLPPPTIEWFFNGNSFLADKIDHITTNGSVLKYDKESLYYYLNILKALFFAFPAELYHPETTREYINVRPQTLLDKLPKT